MNQREAYDLLDAIRQGGEFKDYLPSLVASARTPDSLSEEELSEALDEVARLHHLAFSWDGQLDKAFLWSLRAGSPAEVKLRAALDLMDAGFLVDRGHVRGPFYRGKMPLD